MTSDAGEPNAGDLDATGPTPIAARDENSYKISPEVLAVWRKIRQSDPEAKNGIGLKLAMAAAITAPGNPAEPLGRYTYFKSAHRNKELLPSFDNLTVWEYTKVVSFDYNHSTNDLNWAREMLNTWWRNCSNQCRSKAVSHNVRGEDGDGRTGQQSILCKLNFGPNKPDLLKVLWFMFK